MIVKICGRCNRTYTPGTYRKLPAPSGGEMMDNLPEGGDPVRWILLRICPCKATLAVDLNDQGEILPTKCDVCGQFAPLSKDFNGCICCPDCHDTLRKESRR